MSGLLGKLLGGVIGGGGASEADPAAVHGILHQVLESCGGVSGIISQAQASGLGAHVQSWIGDGHNLPISADQVNQIFSSDVVQGWAAKAGVQPDTVRQIVAQCLPHVVDQATPGGEVSAQSSSSDWSGLLGGLLGERKGAG